jgi:hypothetical protein
MKWRSKVDIFHRCFFECQRYPSWSASLAFLDATNIKNFPLNFNSNSVAPGDYTNFQEAEICTKLFNENEEKRYRMKQLTKTKEPSYNMENIFNYGSYSINKYVCIYLHILIKPK